MAGNWKRNAAPSLQIKLTTFLKSKGRMVSVFPRNDRAVFQIVFRRLLHVHMLVSIEWINYFRNGNDEYLNKYYKTNSSYQLQKLGMMFRVLITDAFDKHLRIKINDKNFEWRFDDSLIIFKF